VNGDYDISDFYDQLRNFFLAKGVKVLKKKFQSAKHTMLR
jgi:hypothetical protein